MSAELASSNCAYRLDRDPGRSVPMTALTSPLLAPPRLSPTVLGVSGVAKFSPHDTYSTSSVPMSSMPSSSYSSPCSEKMRRAGEVSSSFIVASSSSSAIEAGRTAFLPTMAPTRRRVMRVGIARAGANAALGHCPLVKPAENSAGRTARRSAAKSDVVYSRAALTCLVTMTVEGVSLRSGAGRFIK